jgi:hypothetical protein
LFAELAQALQARLGADAYAELHAALDKLQYKRALALLRGAGSIRPAERKPCVRGGSGAKPARPARRTALQRLFTSARDLP